jgi:hypothetical protein
MNGKMITILVVLMLFVGGGLAMLFGYWGQNDDQNWQVLQGVWGKMRIQTDAGYYQKQFASEYTYPKLRLVYFSDSPDEGGEKDGSCKVIFKDKGKATFSSNVVYNTPHLMSGDAIKEGEKGLQDSPTSGFHRLCKGEIEKADKLILARLKEYAIGTAEKLNASDCAENQSAYISEVRKLLKNDALLLSKGIDIEELALSGFTFDETTLLQFKTQQDAILASKSAEAKKIQFDMQKLETEAEYAQQIAIEKGKADMVKMTQVTDAERDKELAEIDAAKKVEVAKLAKQEAIEVANRLLEVAEIEKEAALVVANQKLEVAEFAAKAAEEEKKATIAAAEGKEQAIALSGAITEKEEVLAKIDAEARVKIASALKDIKTPSLVMTGGADGNGGGFDGAMVNIAIMKAAGILPADFSVSKPMTTPTK